MEFIEYQEVLPGLQDQGIEEVTDEHDLARLEFQQSARFSSLHLKSQDSRVEPYPDAVVKTVRKADLPQLLRMFLGKLHLTELLVIPVGSWRAVIDCVAYDLASDEDWLKIDATAALHQNTRNALAISRGETSVLIDMIRALWNHADSPTTDLIITSDALPVILEIFGDGAISVTCEIGMAGELERMIQS